MSAAALDVQGSTAHPGDAIIGSPRNKAFLSSAQRRLHARSLLVCGDSVAIVAALATASFSQNRGVSDQVVAVATIVLPLYLSISASNGAFDIDAIVNPHRGIRRAISSITIVSLLALCLGFALKISATFSRAEQFTAFALAITLLAAARGLNGWLVRATSPRGLFDELLLHDGQGIGAALFPNSVDIVTSGLHPSLDCPHMLDRVSRSCGRFDRVVLSVAPQDRAAWVDVLKGLGTDVHVVMPELNELGILDVGRFDHHLTAVVAKGPLRRPDAIVKRAFDIAAVLALLPGLLLVTLLAAIAIKLDDGGPVFFRQTRIGQSNRKFHVLKFRSMRVDACDAAGLTSTARRDARVTRVGNVLRKTSLDELPQLFNVLLGDMSIVGPRPHALGSRADDVLFWEIDHRYWQRHTVKPGITGLAQVRGFRGATERAEDLTNRVQADLEYITDWSIWRDIRIVALTLKVVLHPNAY